MKTLVIAAFVLLAVYLFSHRDAAVTKCLAALLFVMRSSKNAVNVHIISGTGWARHALRLKAGQVYEFHLGSESTKGETLVSILDSKHNELLNLGPCLSGGSVSTCGDIRYYLRWEFKHSSGKFALSWWESNDGGAYVH